MGDAAEETASGLSFDTIVPPLLLTAIVTRKTAGRGSSGGKMQEAHSLASVSEFDYCASGKSRNQKCQPRLLTTFQDCLNFRPKRPQ